MAEFLDKASKVDPMVWWLVGGAFCCFLLIPVIRRLDFFNRASEL